ISSSTSDTVRIAAAAMVDLWQDQKTVDATLANDPKGKNVLSTKIKKNQAERNTPNFDNRDVGSIMDGYTSEDILNMFQIAWEHEGTSSVIVERFRTHLELLLSHHMYMKGQSRVDIELSDLFSVEMPVEREASPC